jgi:hypothetical protein
MSDLHFLITGARGATGGAAAAQGRPPLTVEAFVAKHRDAFA